MGISLLAVSVLAVCAGALKPHKRPSHLSNRPIVGGVDADISSFPYQVSLAGIVYRFVEPSCASAIKSGIPTIHFCGGSVISVDWVLTAAHCVDGEKPVDIFVHVGTSTLYEGGSYHGVTKIIVHANYDENIGYNYDIALLKVAKPFEFGPNVKPIPLSKKPLRPGEIIVVSGWGVTSEDGEMSTTLKKVEIPVVPQWECKLLYADYELSDYMFCGGRAGRDSCQGDSGGPVVANGFLVGIVSWGEGCARPEYPGIYASIEKLRKWIFYNSGV